MLKRKFEETGAVSQNGEGAGNPESDDSNCSAGSTDALAPDAVDQPPAKRPKKKVNFKGVTVYYFPRRQGFTCVPSEGGSTLGMSEKHTYHRDFSLSDYTKEQKRIHRVILAEQRRQGKFFPSPLLGNASTAINEGTDDISSGSESDSEYDDYYFLQPLPIRQRRVLLRTAGVKKIDNEEKDECRDIRVSRNVCGCDCKIFCDPETCACSLAGIQCQVDRLSFPCGCTKDGCANPSGRIEFNPIRVKTHFIHTLMRLELERKDREIQDGVSASGACALGNISALSPSQTIETSEDSNKIVDVVGEDSDMGLCDLEDEAKTVNGFCDKVNMERRSIEDVGSCNLDADVSSCSSRSNRRNINSEDDTSSTKVLKSNLKTKKEESIDLNLFNSNERGSCRDCQNTDMCNVMMHDVKFSMVSQQQRHQQQHQQQQHRVMAQSLFTGQQILHSHTMSPPSPGLSLFQPLPQQTSPAHHHMMMFNDTEDENSYHADTSGPLYFETDDASYSEMSESSADSSFPVITQTSTTSYRPSTVMFTTSMNTQNLGTGSVSSPVRIMRPQVSLLNRSTLNRFSIRPQEMAMSSEFVPGSSTDLSIAPAICNGISSSATSQHQPPQQHQHTLPDQPGLTVSKPVPGVSQAEHHGPKHLVSTLDSPTEGMPNICHPLNQRRISTDSAPTPEAMPGMSIGFPDSSNSNLCGNFHTSVVSSLGKSACEQLKQSDLMPEHEYSSVLAVPVYHASPNHSDREFERSHISPSTSASTTANNSSTASTAESMSNESGLQHQQPLLSCWSSSLASPTIPDCFTGMGSTSLVPPSLMSQPTPESTKPEPDRPSPSNESVGVSQVMPSPSSTTYATMTTTTRDQLAAYCPGISSHMDNRNENSEDPHPIKEPEPSFSEFPMDGQDHKPTSSLLGDSQNILFCSSFSQPMEPDSSTLSPTFTATPAPKYSPFILSLSSEKKDIDESNPTAVTSSINLQSPAPLQNGHHLAIAENEVADSQSNGILASSQSTKMPTTEVINSDGENNSIQSDSCELISSGLLRTSKGLSTHVNDQETESLAGQDDSDESPKADSSVGVASNYNATVYKAKTGLAKSETSLNESSSSFPSSSTTSSSSSSLSSLPTSAALSLSLSSSALSSTSSSTASSTSSSDDEQKELGQEFNHIVKESITEMVSA